MPSKILDFRLFANLRYIFGLSYELWLPCPAFMNSHALNLVYALKSVVKYVETALAIKVPGAGL